MMEEQKQSSGMPVSGLDSGRFRKLKIFIQTTNGLFSGYTLCQQQQRLLDALNKGGFSGKLQPTSDFLTLVEAEVVSSLGEPRRMDIAFIRKSNILFVGEGQSESAAAPSAAYPIRRKKPVQAAISLAQTTLTGNMHSEMWEELQDALNRSDQFIPVTDVIFNPALQGGLEHADFVAVNKDHIIYVGK
ncbi:hypothetical protein DD509_01990 [Dehalogenimonas alkenigignens]|nr:hypothetical protein DD509_01990 [Dehalogenimonas alkenigignens]